MRIILAAAAALQQHRSGGVHASATYSACRACCMQAAHVESLVQGGRVFSACRAGGG